MAAPNPSGLCMCGCGEPTVVASRTRTAQNIIRGEHVRFVHGHRARVARRKGPDYLLDKATGCWVWRHALSADGYGRVKHGGEEQKAHRHYWEQENGPIPVGLQIDHRCRNRACVNPAHLEPVTPAVNSRRGLQAKLTAADVAEIRSSGDIARRLAARFDVSIKTIRRIRTGRSWKGVAA